MRRSFLESPKRALAAGGLCLGLALMGGEGAVMAVALWAPQVSPQYRAVYMTRSQSCWLPPEEQAAALADPYLAQRPGTLRIDQLDHRPGLHAHRGRADHPPRTARPDHG
jgi:hypothetical protein